MGKKKSDKNKTQMQTEKIVLVTATINLITAALVLLDQLL